MLVITFGMRLISIFTIEPILQIIIVQIFVDQHLFMMKFCDDMDAAGLTCERCVDTQPGLPI